MKTILLLLFICVSSAAIAQDTTASVINQQKHLIKIDVFSLVLGHASVSYEKSVKPGRSLEVGLGVIGRGFKRDERAAGFFAKMGYKFSAPSALYTKNPHPMDGVYARPEISFSLYKQQLGSPSAHVSHSISYVAAGLNLGLQEAVGKVLVLDAYAGINYGLVDGRQHDRHMPNSSQEAKNVIVYHGLLGTTSSSFFLSGGFRIGFLLG
ncbi:MAG TPA: hypothetical protein VEC12_15205 [Bacteroidia bacterium]|nr:hypothetical protein [Bacteroidia bacterium]